VWSVQDTLLIFVVLVVAGSAIPSPVPATAPSAPIAQGDLPVAAAARLAGWYPIYRLGGAAWHLEVDGERGRIVVAVRYWGLDPNASGSSESSNLMVFDLSGNLLHNLSLSSSGVDIVDFDVDRSTGDAYVALRNGTIDRVDPGAGQLVKSWTYWSSLTAIAVQGGDLFVGPCCQRGSVMRLSGTTGAVVRNYTVAGQGDAASIAVDPAGRWFFVVLTAPLVGDIYRVDMTTGLSGRFGSGNDVVLSADGRRVWLCGWGALSWYWLANDTYAGSGVSCPEAPAENPGSGVLALASSGRFIVEAGDVGTFHVQAVGSEPAQASSVGWTADGTALVALAWSTAGYVIGLWDGDPWLNATDGQLLNSRTDPICYPLVTAGGVNESSIVLYRDEVAIGGGTFGMTEACFGSPGYPPVPPADGPHVGRITGLDRVGRILDDSVSFETDGTPPQLIITSAIATATSPYTLSGTVDDPHLLRVYAGNVPVTVSGRDWSVAVRLWIGNNTVGVGAEDTVGNTASNSVVVRYWPSFENRIVDEADRFQVSIPPEWRGYPDVSRSSVKFGAILLAPPEGTYVYNTSATVEARPRPGIDETQAAAYAEAIKGLQEVAKYAVNRPAFLQNTTVDGYPAARIRAMVGSNIIGTNTSATILTQTYVVSAAQGRVYVISMNISWMQSQYRETEDWILESFHVGSAALQPSPAAPSILLIGASTGGVSAVAVALFILWRRRARGSPPVGPG